MNTNDLKRLGLCLSVVFALSAIAASAALAAEDKFHSSVEKTVVTAASEENTVFTFNAGKEKYECKAATMAGTMGAKTTLEIEMRPTFKMCSGTIDQNECTMRLSGRTDENKDAAVEIGCAAGQAIVLTGELCNFKILPQTAKGGGAHYTNGKEKVGEVEHKDITYKLTLSKLIYEKEEVVQNGCPGGAGEGQDGTLNGAFTATGYEDFGGPINWDEFIEGNVVDIEVE